MEKLMYYKIYKVSMKTISFIHYVLVSYSTFHVVISVTENIRRNLDKGNIGCHISIDL